MRKHYTVEELKNIALQYNTRTEFQKGHKGAYLFAFRRNIINQICQHMPILNKRWKLLELKNEAIKYLHRGEFAQKSIAAYSYAHSHGLLDVVCEHMKPLREAWTHDKVKIIASTCKNKKEFRDKYLGAYKYAKRNNLFTEISAHMKKKIIKWSNEEIKEKAMKCFSRREFEARFLGVYKAALKRGIIDDVCSHMKNSSIVSAPEKQLIEIIQQKYSSACKLRKRNINIEEKPWIYGFDIDIYLPELKRGIEFDGTYWHSLHRLKKSKRLWPDIDLKDYHDIKDKYFLSQGIKILHIKEADWIKNKEKCIEKCFIFLS